MFLQKMEVASSMDEDSFLTNVAFFEHERLVHLLVTGFISLFFLMTFLFNLKENDLRLWLLCLLFFVMMIFYIIHYYYLENGVQKLYQIYDRMKGESYELSSENGRTTKKYTKR